MYQNTKDIDVVILAGGKGTRLQSVISDRPKSLAPVAGRSILNHIIDHVADSGFRSIILSVGYMKDALREHITKCSFPNELKIVFSEEEIPLGTGGSIKKRLRRH